MKKLTFIESQLTELSKYAFVTIVKLATKIFISPVLLTVAANRVPSSEHLSYLKYLH